MKILHIIPSMDPSHGGPCQGIRNVIPALKTIDIACEVVCLDDPDAPFIYRDDFVTHALGESKGPWKYHKELVGWLLENLPNYDVGIIHGSWLYPGHAVTRAMALLRKSRSAAQIPKVYLMPHGMLDPYFQQAKGRKLKAIRNMVYWKLIESKVVNQADGVLFTCQEELKLANSAFAPYKPRKVMNVGYGIVRPKPFEKRMQQLLVSNIPAVKNKPFILFLSRIHEKKGVDLLIKAYLKIKQLAMMPLPVLVIAGPGLDSPFGKKMVALAASDPDIVFPGMLQHDMKWAAFYGCEAFILPSHQENFGIAVAEALACGKPVLITDKVNIWREIHESGGGLVATDDLEGAEQLLRRWCNSSEGQKKGRSKNAFLTYQKYFTVEQAALRMKEALAYEAAATVIKES